MVATNTNLGSSNTPMPTCKPPRNPLVKNPHPFGSNSAQAWTELQIAGEGMSLALTRYTESLAGFCEEDEVKCCGDCVFYIGEECELSGAERYELSEGCSDFVKCS